MPSIPGSVSVTGFIAPTDSTDTYAVIDPIYGIDGLRSVVDHAARNGITTARRREGMLVYTQNDGKYWSLKSPSWAGTDADWNEAKLSTTNARAYRLAFVFGDLTSGVLSVTHSLGEKFVSVTIYDNNDKQIIPDEVQLINTTDLQIDISSYGNITGTWNLVVLG